MKKIFNIIMATAVGLTAVSCSNDDDFTESIFDTDIQAVDQDKATAPFDQWLYDNFVQPYNCEIQYKFNFPASNMSFQLAPTDYEKAQLLSHFIKYLFYDVYTKHAGDDFMKLYGPRMFHFVGSASYSPTTGTEVLGYASAGVKITLNNVNNMKMWRENDEYTATDMDLLNKDQFHTMHHEFSHILHQTKSYPVSFGQVTAGTYEPRDWQERDSVESHRLGYVTQYGSSANYEDFVETLSCTITDTDYRWMTTIIDACANGGVKSSEEKADVYELIDSLEIEGLDAPDKAWNNFTLYKELTLNAETNKYEESGRIVPSFHQADVQQHAETSVRWEKIQDFTSFRSFLDSYVEVSTSEETAGISAIMSKHKIARKWYTDNWGLNLWQIRREVRQRQLLVNDYVRQNVTIYPLQ